MGKGKKDPHDQHSLALATDAQVAMDAADEAELEARSADVQVDR